ncbi:MAG TPA: CPBP family intramembrane metalloprotease [Chloroflexi bacterium]|jgi:membrane protease YdiL (CAAX protease family)|nr:CPBP family intramembrane metalloprotease [Chloroflexota bacterium]HPO58569.1 CPBP family intramembrane metalloprotease [Anaerolineaceae bacterium]
MDTRVLILFLSEMLAVVAVLMLVARGPRLRPRKVTLRSPRAESLLGIGLLGASMLVWLVPGLPAGAVFGLNRGALTLPEVMPALQNRALLSLLALLPFAAALLTARRSNLPAAAGWLPSNARQAATIGAGLGMAVLFLTSKFFTLFDQFTLTTLLGLAFWVLIGLAEETIFRGFLQQRLSAWLGTYPGITAAALLSTVWALPALLGLANPAVEALLWLVRSLVLGWMMVKTGHVLASGLYRGLSGWMHYL